MVLPPSLLLAIVIEVLLFFDETLLSSLRQWFLVIKFPTTRAEQNANYD